MANTVDENIKIKCPNLYNDADKQLWINNAQDVTDADCYGEKYNLAVALRACHDYTVSKTQQNGGSGSSGAITSKREGDQAVTFASGSNGGQATDEYLSQTGYGKELISLRTGASARISNTGCPSTSFCCTG